MIVVIDDHILGGCQMLEVCRSYSKVLRRHGNNVRCKFRKMVGSHSMITLFIYFYGRAHVKPCVNLYFYPFLLHSNALHPDVYIYDISSQKRAMHVFSQSRLLLGIASRWKFSLLSLKLCFCHIWLYILSIHL
jgi:hypothetical protein